MTVNISHFKPLVHLVFSDCLRNNSKQLFSQKRVCCHPFCFWDCKAWCGRHL